MTTLSRNPGGARTSEGLKRCIRAGWKHGLRSREAVELRKAAYRCTVLASQIARNPTVDAAVALQEALGRLQRAQEAFEAAN